MAPKIASPPSEPNKPQYPSIDEQSTETPSTNNGSESDQTGSENPHPGRVRVCDAAVGEVNGRERLKRHRVEVAGRIWIPDMWGQEELLKDWTDCTVFDASLRKSSIMSARAALVEEGRIRANSSGLRIGNRC